MRAPNGGRSGGAREVSVVLRTNGWNRSRFVTDRALHPVNAPPYSHHPTVVQRMEIAVTGPGDDEELTALVGRVRGGNAAAFDELARRVRDRVRRWARRVVA